MELKEDVNPFEIHFESRNEEKYMYGGPYALSTIP
jgi:hypothetical protein